MVAPSDPVSDDGGLASSLISEKATWLPACCLSRRRSSVTASDEESSHDRLARFLRTDDVMDERLRGGSPGRERVVHLEFELFGKRLRLVSVLLLADLPQAPVMYHLDGVRGGHEADLRIGPSGDVVHPERRASHRDVAEAERLAQDDRDLRHA